VPSQKLEMVRVDYRKAYDSVSHGWLLLCLHMFKLHISLQHFLELSMRQWRTELTFAGDPLGTVNIKRGIFQGDSFSPLLFLFFCILLQWVTSCGVEQLSIIFCIRMIYGRSKSEITSLVTSVELFSSDFGMTFCAAKCAHLGLKRGRPSIYSTEGIDLPDSLSLRSLAYGETYVQIFRCFTELRC